MHKLRSYGSSITCGISCEDLVTKKDNAITKKRKQYRNMSLEELRYIKDYLAIDQNEDISKRVTIYKEVFLDGEIYAPGDDVVVQMPQPPETCFTASTRRLRLYLQAPPVSGTSGDCVDLFRRVDASGHSSLRERRC